MTPQGPWTTKDFDAFSWHDAHIYGFCFETFVSEEGACDLILDIDFITEWRSTRASDGALGFAVNQAILRFHRVFGFQFTLDYKSPTAGMDPFSISGIERESLTLPNGYKSFHWKLPLNWPSGLMEFDAPGFTQTFIGTPYIGFSQRIPPELRIPFTSLSSKS